jgi:hypothetical protein
LYRLGTDALLLSHWIEENVVKKNPQTKSVPKAIIEAQHAVLAALLYHTGLVQEAISVAKGTNIIIRVFHEISL